MKELMKRAHKMAKEIKTKYPEVNYQAQFGLCLAYLLNNKKEEKIVNINEIKALAKEQGLEANLWEKVGMTRIYFNRYTGAGYRKTSGMFIIEDDGTIKVDKSIYTAEVKAIWTAIPQGTKFEREVK